MTHEEYKQLKEQQEQLNKEKKVLEFSSSNPAEWYELAHKYELIDSRANYAYCIARAVHYSGYPTKIEEPETVHAWQNVPNMGGG